MNRRIVLAVVAMSLAGLLAVSIWVQKAEATTRNFSLYGSATSGWGFTNTTMISPGPTISVDQGDLVNLTLTSQDGQT